MCALSFCECANPTRVPLRLCQVAKKFCSCTFEKQAGVVFLLEIFHIVSLALYMAPNGGTTLLAPYVGHLKQNNQISVSSSTSLLNIPT